MTDQEAIDLTRHFPAGCQW